MGPAAAEGRGAMSDGVEEGLTGAALGDAKWWPPGFRFHPTDEELVLYYLKRKICGRRLRLHMIGDVDVYKWDPWELPEKSLLKSGDKQWYFFSPRDRKYPNGSRSNRATKYGYWKTTGKDRTISQNSKPVGNKKTLVYYHGRAPKGERTDWVMHEYTLDEQVFMSCNNVQDSYALYKVFRKSGPGPKNGEQYGAPFKEEEWEDDGADGSFRNQNSFEDPTSEHLDSAATAGPVGDEVNTLPMGELEDLLLQLSNEQDMIPQLSECPAYVSEIDVGAEVGSHALVSSYIDAAATNHNDSWCELSSMQMSFQKAHPDNAQSTENPEITSLNSCPEVVQVTAEEGFLEIRDFNDPEPVEWNMDEINNQGHLHGMDEINNQGHLHGTDLLYDLYDYFDAPMFLPEAFEPLDGAAHSSYFNDFGVDGRPNEASHITTELWAHEQAHSVSTAAESTHNIMAPPPLGTVYDSTSSNLRDNIQGQISPIGGASPSWFGSALSALLDSIPSRPAIASEGALISRALERVSSFKSGQIGAREPNAAINGGTAVSERRRGGHNGGFLFISFLVAVGAVLWVLGIGAVVKVIKGLWGRFIPPSA